MKKNKKAFTLVELLVVIAILGILGAVGIVGYTSFKDKAGKSRASSELTQVVGFLSGCDADDDDFEITASTFTFASEKDFDDLKEKYSDLAEIKGSFVPSSDGTTVTYTIDGYSATWTVATNEIA